MSVDTYTNLITSEHRDKPKFVATVELITQCYCDIQDVVLGFIDDFNLDTAIGAQLDAVGEWIGQSRAVSTRIEGVYFTWDDTVQTGWDNSVWKKTGDPSNETTILDDDTYRRLLYAKIKSNNWKGELSGVYDIIDTFIVTTPSIKVKDNQNMSIKVTIPSGQMPDIDLALITNGYVIFSPASVQVFYEII